MAHLDSDRREWYGMVWYGMVWYGMVQRRQSQEGEQGVIRVLDVRCVVFG